MKIKESPFEGSPLKNEMTHTKHADIFYKMVKRAHENKPNSLFWRQAFGFIEQKYLKSIKTKKK